MMMGPPPMYPPMAIVKREGPLAAHVRVDWLATMPAARRPQMLAAARAAVGAAAPAAAEQAAEWATRLMQEECGAVRVMEEHACCPLCLDASSALWHAPPEDVVQFPGDMEHHCFHRACVHAVATAKLLHHPM